MDWNNDPHPTRAGRVLRSFGEDLESVVFAVVGFLSGGILLFLLCFVTTKCMQCYKARQRKKRRQAMGEDDDDDDELEAAVMSGVFQNEEEESRLVEL